ncbi:MAG TPA: heme lyase CcmF/NrfE family subunit [Streptosporangiaceae bacterium]|nr:heme lyase CcmF/NrfE family subunit [Streptosporangiaceae bacterium]
MSQLGTYLLLFGLAVAGYGLIAAAVGAKTGRPGLVESARRCAFGLFAICVAANATMMTALLTNDFTIKYVAENSARETPTFFKALSLWAADDGSLLLWNLILAGFIAAVALRFRRDRPRTFPYALAVLFSVQVFYLILVNGPARPFGGLANPPLDGRGPAPLLQNYPLMAVHPPFLYLGFIGFTVPFAFGIAALLAGEDSGQWISLIRRWTLVVWCFLTVGLLLGALWSYSVLGWGGYWAWDPVENVALLPWLTATAFLHSVMLQERRGMAKLWNIALVIGAFALMTFGTFLTRGNVLSSVHAFAQTSVGPAYLAFLALVLLAGFGLVAWRMPSLRTSPSLTSAISREGAFVANNVLLLAATAIILLGTTFPLIVQALSGQQITIGGPYFTRSVAPVFLLILLLAGTAPLLPWRAANRSRALRRLRFPAIAAAIVMIATAVAGARQPVAIAGFGLAALVFVTSGQEILAALAIGRRAHPGGVLHALRRGRRRQAGMVVHLGLALAAAGITASSTLGHQAQVTLKTGQSTVFGGQVLRYQGLRTDRQPQRIVLTTTLSVTSSSGASAGKLNPSINLYPAATEPIGSPSIRRGMVWDLYASLISLQDDGGKATFRLYRNPGVNWLWLGGLIMALGGVAAAWPTRRRRKTGDTRPADPDGAASGSSEPPERAAVEAGAL